MATAGQKETGVKLVNVGTLILDPVGLDPRGVVVHGDKLMVTDTNFKKVHLHRRRDSMLISSSDKLEECPWGLCFVNDTEICVVLNNGIIALMEVQNNGVISTGKTINAQPSFDCCHDVVKYGDKIIVSGVKDNKIYWCFVSLQDGQLDKLQNVCEGRWSYLATKEDMIYVSCNAVYNENGVYGFNLLNPSQPSIRYKPKELWSSSCGITMDNNGYLYLCDWGSHSIHYLTDQCELVTIFKEGIPECPFAIFWDSGILYVTAFLSNVITMYQTHQKGDHNVPEVNERDEIKQAVFETPTQIRQVIRTMDLVEQMSSGETYLPAVEECQLPLRRRSLPPGKKYHVFFSYSSSDITWVKETVERLEKDHGFVCCEYDRDNTPGTSLLKFASDSISNAYKTVVIMTREALKSDFVLYEFEMAIIQSFNEKRKCVVPVLLEDCEVPSQLNVLNYIDARDPKMRDIWWPKFVTELKT